MAKVVVKYRGLLVDFTKLDEEVLNVNQIKDILKHIKLCYGPEAEKKAKSMLITIDGDSMFMRKGFKSKLNDGEIVQFFPICGGG
ncbi:MAG: hypothetical protein FWG82_05260 [Oscillospiraceae bacterium]|nr:hypothetical protein [Oscillospiraceae bacterium]